jgi:AraC family ethanolamine operon transcriptional activator
MTEDSLSHIEQVHTDLSDLAESAKAWKLSILKLDSGEFQGCFQQTVTPNCITGHLTFKSRLKQQGVPPAGYRTFIIPAHAEHSMIWRHKQVGGNDLLLFPRDGALEAATTADFDIFTLSVFEKDLCKIADKLKYCNFVSKLSAHEVFTCERASLDHAIKKISQYGRSDHEKQATLLRELLILLVLLISEGKTTRRPTIPGNRQRIISATESLVMSRPDTPPTVEEICRTLGICERTLQYTFRDVYQVSPKFYINAIRLHAVYAELRKAPSSNKITDIANKWGFWHMGQFAACYRKLFGVLPSNTLHHRT